MRTRIAVFVCALLACGGITAVATSRAQSPVDPKTAALEKRITELEKQVAELRNDLGRIQATPIVYKTAPASQPSLIPPSGPQPDYYFNGKPVYRILLNTRAAAGK